MINIEEPNNIEPFRFGNYDDDYLKKRYDSISDKQISRWFAETVFPHDTNDIKVKAALTVHNFLENISTPDKIDPHRSEMEDMLSCF